MVAAEGLGMALAKRRGLKRATVAVARKLAVLLHRLWADQADFRWPTEEATAA
jgi:transposase